MPKTGYVAVVGRPNAGKSSLLNYLVQEKIALVSHKANATRKRANIIVMHKDNQIIFIDTPGLHEREKLLNQFMLDEALKAMGDCDLILFLSPIKDNLDNYKKFLEKNKKNIPHIVLLTKIDFVNNDIVLKKIKEFESFNPLAIIPITIKKDSYRKIILDEIIKHLPNHPYLFDPEILTTEHLRDIYKEFIREAIFENISDEIPYESDVLIEKIEEKPNVDIIKAQIVVEKRSQKGMIIGKGGNSIKRIGKTARKKIELLSGKKCFLELFVSVRKGWSKNKKFLEELGYRID